MPHRTRQRLTEAAGRAFPRAPDWLETWVWAAWPSGSQPRSAEEQEWVRAGQKQWEVSADTE